MFTQFKNRKKGRRGWNDNKKNTSLLFCFMLMTTIISDCCGVEWDCASSSNTGTFTRSSSCTISGSNHVDVTNTLEIVGGNTDMDNLVTITAASGERHFYMSGANDKLTLR